MTLLYCSYNYQHSHPSSQIINTWQYVKYNYKQKKLQYFPKSKTQWYWHEEITFTITHVYDCYFYIISQILKITWQYLYIYIYILFICGSYCGSYFEI